MPSDRATDAGGIVTRWPASVRGGTEGAGLCTAGAAGFSTRGGRGFDDRAGRGIVPSRDASDGRLELPVGVLVCFGIPGSW